MNIAYIVTRSDTIGGSSIHVRDFCLELQRRGGKATVLLGGNGYFTDHLGENSIDFKSLNYLSRTISPIKDRLAYQEIKQHLADLKPDLVSLHSSKAGFLGRLAAHSLGIPVLFTAHGWSFTDGIGSTKRWLFSHLEAFVSKKSDRIICVSDYDRNIGLNQLPVNGHLIKTIYNGMPDIDSELIAKPGSTGTVHICMIARFDQQKDHSTLIHALEGLNGFHLHLVGDGPLLHDIRQLSSRMGFLDQITFYGRSEDVANILSKSHMFTLISNWEGFPRSTLEAMRAGLPVVVSDVGGAAEAIVEGETGYSIPKGDVAFLREKLHLLISDPQLRKRMGKAARQRYETHFTFDQMFEKTYQIYQEVLSERASLTPENDLN